jgi:hypothetical protein
VGTEKVSQICLLWDLIGIKYGKYCSIRNIDNSFVFISSAFLHHSKNNS